MILIVVLVFLHLVNGQTLNGAFVKFDYCKQGSSGCIKSDCGNSATRNGWCIADNYILLHNCTASGLGMNQPANDPNVFSKYQCGSVGLRTNYSSLADCDSDQSPLQPIQTKFVSLGYSSFCWGGTITPTNNQFGQFNMSLGYYVVTTYRCPGNNPTIMQFVEDPTPHACVANQQSCPSGSTTPSFVTSTVCYPGTSTTSSSSNNTLASGVVATTTTTANSHNNNNSNGNSMTASTSTTTMTSDAAVKNVLVVLILLLQIAI